MKQLILSNRARLAFLHDIAVTGLSLPAALLLRLGDGFNNIPTTELLFSTLILVLLAAPIYIRVGMYKGIWRFASLEDMISVTKAVSVLSAVFLVTLFLLSRLEWMPRSVPIISWFILVIVLCGSRAAYRILRDRKTSNLLKASAKNRIGVLLVGSGPEADLFLRETRSAEAPVYNVLGMLAFDKRRVGLEIKGTPILGTTDQLDEALLEGLPSRPSKLILTKQNVD
ncbi:MAG: polysaccharide biosynthesis protein, partial [Alphaproteobacteria bacterium]|nr:polysaccharide biosynthesis protein [Alphaproteobacteria bacterium]